MNAVSKANRPTPLSQRDWVEIIALPEFQVAWGVTTEKVEDLIPRLYGARFDFTSGGPGYVGPLYLIYGDSVGSGAPLVVTKNNGRLAAIAI
jgi:hypothetical protein